MLKSTLARILLGAERSWKLLFSLLVIWSLEMVLVTFAARNLGGWNLVGYLNFPLILPVILWFCWLNGSPDD
ncbi:MAG: hypothetical protein JWS10_3500 [Cypionkella sp.]|nr:hypothetical protein [Cypionkella sp.]